MLTWHLFTSDQTVLFEQNGQTVLLQTQCLISEPVDKFLKHALLQHVTLFLHAISYFKVGPIIYVSKARTTLPNSVQYVKLYH